VTPALNQQVIATQLLDKKPQALESEQIGHWFMGVQRYNESLSSSMAMGGLNPLMGRHAGILSRGTSSLRFSITP